LISVNVARGADQTQRVLEAEPTQGARKTVQELSSDGKTAVVGWDNGIITLQDPRTDEPRRIIKAYEAEVRSVTLSPDGSTLASAGLVLFEPKLGETGDAGILDAGIMRSYRIEHKVWDVKTTKLLCTLSRPVGEVKWANSNKVVFSRDSQILATFGYYTPVRLWNARSGELLRTLPETRPTTTDYVAFSRDGAAIAVGGNRHEWIDSKTIARPISEVRIFDLQSGEQQNLISHIEPDVGSSLNALAFSPDGALLAAGVAVGKQQKINESSSQFNVARGEVWLWDIRNGRLLSTLRRHRGLVSSLAFSPDGKQIASGSSDETVQLWAVSTGKAQRVLPMYGTQEREETVETKPAAPGTQIEEIITENADRTSGGSSRSTSTSTSAVAIEAPGTHTIKRIKLSTKGKGVKDLFFEPDGRTLQILDDNGRLNSWNVSTPIADNLPLIRRLLPRFDGRVTSLALSPDGKLLVTGGYTAVRVWDVAAEQEQRILAQFKDGGHAVAIANTGVAAGAQHILEWRMISANSGEGHVTGSKITLWNTATGETLQTLNMPETAATAMAFSPDGKVLAVGGVIYGKSIPKSVSQTTRPDGDFEVGVSIGPNDPAPEPQELYGELTLWETSTGKLNHTVRVPGAGITTAAFSPDGKTLATEHEKLGVKLWNTETGELMRTIDAPPPPPPGSRSASFRFGYPNLVSNLAFSPDGKSLVRVQGNKAKVWDSQTGELKAALDKSEIISAAFHPDGKRVATGNREGSISIWDMPTQKLLWKSDTNPETPIEMLTFSANGNILATNFNGTVRLWDYSSAN
jgi:WD40 repeat protein